MQAGLPKKREGTFQTFVGSSFPVPVCAKAVITLSALQQRKALLAVPSHAALMVGFLSKGCLKSRVICHVFSALQDLKKDISQFTIYFMFKSLIYYIFELC